MSFAELLGGKETEFAQHLHTVGAHEMGFSFQHPMPDEAFLCLELTQILFPSPGAVAVSKEFSFLSFAKAGSRFPVLPARPPATPAPVIRVPQGSLPQNRRTGSEPRGAQPAVGGQGVAGPPASIPSMCAAGSNRFSLAHPLSACPILGSVVWREAFHSLVWSLHQPGGEEGQIREVRHSPRLLGRSPLSDSD